MEPGQGPGRPDKPGADPHHRARRRFGQNFLHDPAVIDRIARAVSPAPGDALVEIGPGTGALTRALFDAGADLDVIEIDRDLAAHLAQMFPGNAALRIHNVDALDFDYGALAAKRGPLRLIGNLPYNISTPLLFRFIASAGDVRDMHLMLQREVADRIHAPPGSKTYGRLSVMVQFHCRVTSLFGVGPGAFRPAPRIRSAVVRLEPRSEPPAPLTDAKCLERIVTLAFGQRRKTLRNALKTCLPESAIRGAGIDPGARAETLTLDQFAALANALAAVTR